MTYTPISKTGTLSNKRRDSKIERKEERPNAIEQGFLYKDYMIIYYQRSQASISKNIGIVGMLLNNSTELYIRSRLPKVVKLGFSG